MSFKWKYKKFDQSLNAYIDWTQSHRCSFPPGHREYLISATWILKPNAREDVFGFLSSINPNFFSSIYRESHFLKDENVFTTHMPPEAWERLLEDGQTSILRREAGEQVIVGRPIPIDSWCAAASKEPKAACPGDEVETIPDNEVPVVVGVIDEGLAFANERFRNDLTKSRVEYAWVQDAACGPGGVPGYHYGRELTKWDRLIGTTEEIPGIDSLLERCREGGLVDEDLFYALAGVADFGREGHKAAAWRLAHGAHVMDLAAGYDMKEAKQHRHIISVQLPTSIVADTSGLGLEKFMLDGVTYIFDRASKISERYCYGRELPVVINFSSGVRAGPHDGSTLIERFLDRLIENRRHPPQSCGKQIAPTQIVLPAGNSFQARSHVCFSLRGSSGSAGSDIDTVDWHVPPDDQSFSYVELWLPAELDVDEMKKVALTISAPGDETTSGALLANTQCSNNASVTLTDEKNCNSLICKAYFQQMPVDTEIDPKKPPNLLQRGRFLIALAPTAFHDTPATLAPAGNWTLSLSYSGTEHIEVHGWIHWDEPPINYSRFGRQSFFEDPCYFEFDETGALNEDDNPNSAIRRTGTINAIATGGKPVVVGGYRASDGRAALYSSGDFKGHTDKPDYLAVSEASETNLGQLAAGTRSGSTVAMNGTSVAAPQVAREIADMMAEGKDDQEITTALNQKASDDDQIVAEHALRRNPDRDPDVSPERKGRGRLILPATRPSNMLRGEFGPD